MILTSKNFLKPGSSAGLNNKAPISHKEIKIKRKQNLIKETAANNKKYLRAVDLPHLIPLWPRELEDTSKEATLMIIKKLQKALRTERKRAAMGHWSYSINKHKALLEALNTEKNSLTEHQKRK